MKTADHLANDRQVLKGHGRLSHQKILQTNGELPDKRYDVALSLMKRGGSKEKAYEMLVAAAKDNDAHSKYALGTWYLHGFFVKKNLRNAIKLLRAAADKNIPFAAFDLAVCYELGQGVRKNMDEAAKYYMRAFLFGDVEGAVELERILYWSKDVCLGRKWSKEFGRFLGNIGK